MKQVITIFFVFVFTIATYGQRLGLKIESTTLDQAAIRCYYQFVQKDKANQLLTDTMTLDIGAQISEYYDITKQKQDELKYPQHLQNPSNISSISVRKNLDEFDGATYYTTGRRKESSQLLKNRHTGEITIIDAIQTLDIEKYRFTETIRPQAWQIAADTATILGYSCQKATVAFRGRSYEAWFCPEIPINDGPWKFFGLPGLILRVYDTENIFSFVCVGIENLNPLRDITIEQIKYINCTRDDLAKIKLKQTGETGVIVNGGNILIAALKPKDNYNSLELE